MSNATRTAFCCVFCAVVTPGPASAQVCGSPAGLQDRVPRDPAPASPYTTLGRDGETPFEQIPLGIGHVHNSASNPVLDVPPGGDDWLRRVQLPLSHSPGEEPFAWIVDGWIVGSEPPTPLTTNGLVETGYEEASFLVLAERSDGWLRIRYLSEPGDAGTAWTPVCALEASPAKLDFTRWSDWVLGEEIGPLYFRSAEPADLRSEPARGSALLRSISGDYAIEPLEIRGEWMRVELRQPSDYCAVDVETVRQEGWIRWYDSGRGPLVWYFTRGC